MQRSWHNPVTIL
ncbi:unnamed protein product, partial [Rotaria sp. Silwood2]